MKIKKTHTNSIEKAAETVRSRERKRWKEWKRRRRKRVERRKDLRSRVSYQTSSALKEWIFEKDRDRPVVLQYLMSSTMEGNTMYEKEAFPSSGPQAFFVPGLDLHSTSSPDAEDLETNQVRSLLRRNPQGSEEGRPLNSHLHPLAWLLHFLPRPPLTAKWFCPNHIVKITFKDMY